MSQVTRSIRRGRTAVAVAAVVAAIGVVGTPAAAAGVPPLDHVVSLAAVNTDATKVVISTTGPLVAPGPLQLLDRASGTFTPFPAFAKVSGDLSAVITVDHRWVDVATGTSVPIPEGKGIDWLSRDGRKFVAGSADGQPAWVFDIATGQHSVLPIGGIPMGLSPNARWALVMGDCNTATGSCDAYRVDLATGSVTKAVSKDRHETPVSNIADTGRLLVQANYTTVTARDVDGRVTPLAADGGGVLSDDGTVLFGTDGLTVVAERIGDPHTISYNLAGTSGHDSYDPAMSGDGRHMVVVQTSPDGSARQIHVLALFGAGPAQALRGGQTAAVPVTGQLGVPADASAVTLNVTVTDPSAAGFLTVWPCGTPRPLAANVNFAAGAITGSVVVAGIGTAGSVCYSSNVDVNVVIDIQGWFTADASYHPLRPGRLTDTRNGETDTTPNVPAAQTVVIAVAGHAAVPTDATAVTVSVIATNTSAAGYVTVWPCDEPRPLAANLNVEAGETRANTTFTKLAGDGTICAWSNVALDLVVDAQGWFGPSSSYTAINPTRLADTRHGEGDTTPNLQAWTPLVLQAPPGASAVVVEVAATNASGPGFVTVWPCDQPRPLTSNLNFTSGRVATANTVIAAVDGSGTVCAAANVDVDLVIDLQGSFAAAAGYRPLVPARLLDTRLAEFMPPTPGAPTPTPAPAGGPQPLSFGEGGFGGCHSTNGQLTATWSLWVFSILTPSASGADVRTTTASGVWELAFETPTVPGAWSSPAVTVTAGTNSIHVPAGTVTGTCP